VEDASIVFEEPNSQAKVQWATSMRYNKPYAQAYTDVVTGLLVLALLLVK
jgi:hypothetical protein